MEQRRRVGILGATGVVGQKLISLLENHPWFEVTAVAASDRSSGMRYEDAMRTRQKEVHAIPEQVKDLRIYNVNEIEEIAKRADFVFSALDMKKEEIYRLEEDYARHEIPVVSNNSAHRWTLDVPMVIPEINAEHFDRIEGQRKRLGTTRGFIVTKPNCSIQSYVPALTAWMEYEPKEVAVTTYQAVSGAGKCLEEWPEIGGNVIPFIAGEEKKSEDEPLRIWGREPGEEPRITAQCLRVPVQDGHLAAVFVKFGRKPTKEQLIEKLVNFKGFPQEAALPSAPRPFIQYLEEVDRPQTKLDVGYEHGMGISIGRLREDQVFDYKFVGLSHNTIRGAAGGAILCAETLVKKGYL